MPTNYERVLEPRPAAVEAWVQLNTSIKATMDFRRYELVTFAAARRLKSSYCCLVHGGLSPSWARRRSSRRRSAGSWTSSSARR